MCLVSVIVFVYVAFLLKTAAFTHVDFSIAFTLYLFQCFFFFSSHLFLHAYLTFTLFFLFFLFLLFLLLCSHLFILVLDLLVSLNDVLYTKLLSSHFDLMSLCSLFIILSPFLIFLNKRFYLHIVHQCVLGFVIIFIRASDRKMRFIFYV